MHIINGKTHSTEIYNSIKKFISNYHESTSSIVEFANSPSVPTLAFFLIGNRDDSKVYVGIKKRTCEKLGFKYVEYLYDNTVSFDQLKTQIEICNKNDRINGILVQCPLPKHIDESKLMSIIDPKKDVDGFHSENSKYLLENHISKHYDMEFPLLSQIKEKNVHFYPCTPLGIISILCKENVEIKGKRIAIIGCGRVGRPLSMMFVQFGGVPTLCNSSTNSLRPDTMEKIVGESDILITCTGVYNVVNVDWIKDETVIIDVGVQRVNDKLTGELDREKLEKRNVFATPVPGGVGPMTVAMLMNNLTLAWFKQVQNRIQSMDTCDHTRWATDERDEIY